VIEDEMQTSTSSLAVVSPPKRISPSTAATTRSKAWDPSRVPVAVASLIVLLVGVLGWAFRSGPAKETGFVLFALIGFGSACVIAVRRGRWPALAFSAPLGLSLVLLVGFVLVETKTWSAGVPVFAIAVIAAACLNLWEIVRTVFARIAPGHRGRPRHVYQSVQVATEGTLSKERAQREETLSVDPGSRKRLSVLALALAVVGLLVCLAAAGTRQHFIPHGPRAMLGALPPAWYAGMACVVVAVVVGLVVAGWVAGTSVAILQATVTLTPAIVYSLPRYDWTYKHLGLVEYVLAHGTVNPRIDIYQAWPSLFAGVAWLCHALGVHNATAIARWWPAAIDVATVFVVQRLAFRVLGSSRRAWLAAAIVVVGNMIGQDYFSPQSTGFFLAIAVFAAVYRRREEPRRLGAVDWALVITMIVAIAVTHQLSPYMITGATVILVLFGLCRSRMVPVVSLAAAAGWALLHTSTVQRYFSFNQIGAFTTNVLTNGFVSPSVHKRSLIHDNAYAMAAEVALLLILAGLVLLQRRTKVHIALALCAASGLGLLVAQSYGNEGVFRVVLFALPWLAMLAADWNGATAPRLYWLPVVSLPLLLVAYLFIDYGLDFIHAIRPGDLRAAQTFERVAPPGSRLYTIGGDYLPVRSSARYNLLTFRDYPYVGYAKGSSQKHLNRFNAVTSYDQFMVSRIPGSTWGLRGHKYYVIMGSGPEAAAEELGYATKAEYAALENQFLHSGQWQVVQRTSTAVLFKLVSVFLDSVPPSIAGTPQDGQRLSANRGTWSSLNPLKFKYQWELCDASGKGCVPIPGATHQNFEPRSPDIGHRLTVVVHVEDTTGRVREASSALTAIVSQPPPPRNAGAPTVLGVAEDGGVVTSKVGKWSSPDNLTYHYQWQECASSSSVCAPIQGKTKANLRLDSSLVGHFVSLVVTAVDQEGSSTRAVSAAYGPVGPPPPPVNVQAPTIGGSATVGSNVFARIGAWRSPDHLSFSYQWELCGASPGAGCNAIPGALNPTYHLRAADIGFDIEVVVTATDAEGQRGSAYAVVGPVVP